MARYITDGYGSLSIETGIDLTGASNTKILYKTPSGRKGEFSASVSGTELTYQLSDSDIAVSGQWEFQTRVTIGGLTAYGEITKIRFKIPLDK